MQPLHKVDWKEVHERNEAAVEIASLHLVPRIQELDAVLSMMLNMRDSGADNINGYSANSIVNIMLPHLRDMTRGCLKITDRMVGIDRDTSPLGGETSGSS